MVADILETGLPHQEKLISAGDRAAYSLRPRFDAREEMRGQFPLQDDVGKLQPATLFQDPMNFLEKPRLVRRKIDRAIGDDRVVGVVRKWQQFRGNEHNFGVCNPHGGEVGRSSSDHFRRKIDAVNPARGPGPSGGAGKVESRAAADIQNNTPFLERSHGEWVANAAKGIHQVVGRFVKDILRITKQYGAFLADRIGEISCGRRRDRSVFISNCRADSLFFILAED